MDDTNLYRKIALALATELGFTCYSHGTCNHGPWQGAALFRFVKEQAGARSPYMPDSACSNPCRELPLDYTVYIYIRGTDLSLHDRLDFDLNDPELMDKLRKKFSDLKMLQFELDGTSDKPPAEDVGEPGLFSFKQPDRSRHSRKGTR